LAKSNKPRTARNATKERWHRPLIEFRNRATLAGVEYCFMYVVQNDVVDTVIGPPDYIEQVFNEGRQNTQEARSPLPRNDHD
jgi:hypothetical protein